MSVAWTSFALVVCLILAAGAIAIQRRERAPGDVLLIPWNAVLFVALVGALLCARHLMSFIAPP